MAIRSFGNSETEKYFLHGDIPPKGCGWQAVVKVVARKLDMIDAAASLIDLRAPPGNRLEALQGDLVGFHSIRVNEQWPIIFQWKDGFAEEVEIVDYH